MPDNPIVSKLVDKLESEFSRSFEPGLFLYYRPSTETEPGDAIMSPVDVDGYILGDNRVYRPSIPYQKFRCMVRGALIHLPILPFGK